MSKVQIARIKETPVASQAVPDSFFSTAPLVEAMLQAGCHQFAGGHPGMSASDYRALWPRAVLRPPEYAGRFNELLLVDRTLGVADLLACARVEEEVLFVDCRDSVGSPCVQNSRPLNRYVAFVQTGRKNLGKGVCAYQEQVAPDEIGLTVFEGLFLPFGHENVLRQRACDLPGSVTGDIGVPYLLWFGRDRPLLGACHRPKVGHGSYGCASRGRFVIPVP